MQRYQKIAAAVFSLLMALSVPAFAFGEGSRQDHAWAEVKTLPDLPSLPGTGSGLALIPQEWRVTERSLLNADGSILLTDAVHHVIWKIKDENKSIFAGLELPLGYDEADRPKGALLDGAADHAYFNKPAGLAADGKGNVYVADAGNHAIRKIDTQGQVTTIAGDGVQGFQDGKGKEARFNAPEDVAAAQDGTIYVADTLNHVIRKIAVSGEVSTLNGRSSRVVEVYPGVVSPAGSYRDGALAQALFNEPSGLALDEKGNLYVSDTGNQAIRYIDFGAGTVSTVAGRVNPDDANGTKELYTEGGYADGNALQAEFHFPRGIAWVPSQQMLYVADSLNGVIRVIKDGVVHTLLGSLQGEAGKTDGTERNAKLDHPEGISVSPDGSGGWITGNGTRTWSIAQPPADRPSGEIAVAYESSWLSIQPEMKDGKTMVLLRDAAAGLGFAVASITKDKIELQQGDRHVFVERTDDAFTRENKLYVPVRLLAESLGKDVEWLSERRMLWIRDK